MSPGTLTGSLSTLAEGFAYCNGIALSGDGGLLVTDHRGIRRIGFDGARSLWATSVSETGIDGLALDSEGRVYLAVVAGSGVKVLEGGEEIDFLALPEGSLATNCCFGGPAFGSLFVTDAHHGRVYEFSRMPTPGYRRSSGLCSLMTSACRKAALRRAAGRSEADRGGRARAPRLSAPPEQPGALAQPV